MITKNMDSEILIITACAAIKVLRGPLRPCPDPTYFMFYIQSFAEAMYADLRKTHFLSSPTQWSHVHKHDKCLQELMSNMVSAVYRDYIPSQRYIIRHF